MTSLLLACAVVLAVGSAAATYALHELGTPSTVYEWFAVFCWVVLFTSIGTAWIMGLWWILRIDAGVGDDEGWQQRYRQQTRLFHRGEEFKIERLIVIISLSVFFAMICAGSIANLKRTAPIPSYFDVDALPR
ncbi:MULTISPECIES: hypothetical protein [unclassified Ensifer]|uniref:hypothetical protein n=1 Tax=unclassified Ensifer TaxID=2633371 RepID=UPI00300FCD22